MKLTITLICICSLLSFDILGQWTNGPTTIHDGGARINHSTTPLWNINLTDSTPDSDDYGGLSILQNNLGVAHISYNYATNRFHFGSDINNPEDSWITIDLDNPDVSMTSDGALTIGKTNSRKMSIDGNEIQAKFGDSATSIFFNHEGGFVSIGPSGSSGQFFLQHNTGVGLGTNSPEANLHIVSDDEAFRIDGDNPNIHVYENSVKNMSMGYKDQVNAQPKKLYLQNDDNGGFNISVNNTHHSTLTEDGKLGIGTSNPGQTLSVVGDAYVTGVITFASDKRLKKNITSIRSATNIVSKLNPVSYNFKNQEYESLNLSEKRRWGLIAQEVEEILPELVSNISNNESTPLIDTPLKSVNYTDLIAILIQSNQNLQDKINHFISLNRAHESKLRALEVAN